MPDHARHILQYAGRLLSRKAYSEHALRQKLTGRFGPDPAIENVIDKLKALNYLNDLQLAADLAAGWAGRKGWGSRRIRHELQSRGYAGEAVEAAAARADAEHEPGQRLEEAVAKWLRIHGAPGRLGDLKRLENYLLRQGFEPHLIGKRISAISILPEENEHDRE